MVFEQVIYITDKERKILDNRTCLNCGNKLMRKGQGIEQWINTQFCCKMCMLDHRKEVGMILENKEYKCRRFNSNNNAQGLTVPKWFVDKYDLFGKYYKFGFYAGKSICYFYSKKKKGSMKLRKSSLRNYYQIGIPMKIVKEFDLEGKLFKFKEEGRKILFYTEI